MARPKKSDRDAMATVRIEDAFWKLLGEMSYSDITVLRISQESGTNRNSLYYHYKSIDDLARSAFMNNVDTEVSGVLFSALLSGEDADNNGTAPVFGTELLIHARRIMLCAGSDSSFLNRLVKDLLIRVWFDALEIDASALSSEEHLQVDFIFSGLVSVLGRPEVKDSPLIMSDFSRTEIGKAAITTMKRISENQCNAKERAVL